MKDLNKYTVEELIEIGSFSSLNETQKQIVLKEMTAEKFDKLRKVLLGAITLISVDKFTIEPNSGIEKALLEKVKSRKDKKSVVKQFYIYGSSVAAVLVLFFMTYTYFFKEEVKTKSQPVVEVKNEVKPKKTFKNPESETVQTEKDDTKDLREIEKGTENKVRKENFAINQTKKEEEPSPAESPEEFKFLTDEIIIEETDDDANLARFSDESERAFHYYTRLN